MLRVLGFILQSWKQRAWWELMHIVYYYAINIKLWQSIFTYAGMIYAYPLLRCDVALLSWEEWPFFIWHSLVLLVKIIFPRIREIKVCIRYRLEKSSSWMRNTRAWFHLPCRLPPPFFGLFRINRFLLVSQWFPICRNRFQQLFNFFAIHHNLCPPFEHSIAQKGGA